MDTVRVNICYRPLRICWAIEAGDFAAFRKAIEFSNTMWGGRFNPIAIVDRAEEAERIVEVFRADLVLPLGESEAVKAFPKRFPHLINPFFHETLFTGTHSQGAHAQVLDIHNALVQLRDTQALTAIKNKGFRLYEWDETDPLANVFLMHLGTYPNVADTRIAYRELVKQALDAKDEYLDAATSIPGDIFEHPSVSYLSRHGMTSHHGIRSDWNFPGFFLGDASNLDDLVCCWNLRATNTGIFFVDRNNLPRYQHIISAWTKITKETLSYRRFEHQRGIAVWERRETMAADPNTQAAELTQTFGEGPFTICAVDVSSWNGLNLQAPMMMLGEATQLGVLATDTAGKPKLSFALGDKPFCDDTWFHTQHLVASLSFIGGLYGDDLHTLDAPYVPELNEFYARTMCFEYNKLRIEPDSVGLVVDAADSDAFIYALSVADLFEQIFQLAGYSARPSSGGLITRQLIAQMGGLRGAAVFKIPGVRRLLKTFGPTESFTARDAINKIGSRDPENPTATFKDFEDNLYIEPRPHGTKLKATDVFTYLVEKGLFRMGSRLTCPHCRMASWTALDILKQRVTCEMCGREFDATRQLVTGECHYRRSGVLGAEKNAQGAVPVTLTLQQLMVNLGIGGEHVYATSLDLEPERDSALPKCEVDFAWIVSGRQPGPITIILGECKDRGRKQDGAGDGGTIDSADIEKLKAVADALPSKRFETYVLLAKLCPFTPQEIDAARTLNDRWRRRAILLTERELEPWKIYDRTSAEFKINRYASSAEQLAMATATMYFPEPAQQPPT